MTIPTSGSMASSRLEPACTVLAGELRHGHRVVADYVPSRSDGTVVWWGPSDHPFGVSNQQLRRLFLHPLLDARIAKTVEGRTVVQHRLHPATPLIPVGADPGHGEQGSPLHDRDSRVSGDPLPRHSNAFDDLQGVADVGPDGLVHGGQSATVWMPNPSAV